MNNPRIGQLAGMLLDMEDAGREGTEQYRAVMSEYDHLKSLPENWPDVRAEKRTPEQARLADEAKARDEEEDRRLRPWMFSS